MKNIFKRIACLLLASSFILAASCADNKGGENDESEVPDSAPIESSEEETQIPDGLPEVNYNEETYMLYISGHTYDDFTYNEEKKGDVINDAVFTRNLNVEERLNIKLETYTMGSSEDVAETLRVVRTLIGAGDEDMDIIASGEVFLAPLLYEDILVDWNTLSYVDFNKPWWDDGILDAVNFGNKIYMTAGDMVMSSLNMTGILLFNKKLMNDYNLVYPYQTVLDGKWTYDNMIPYVLETHRDLNGDGKYKWGDDMYGYAGWFCETGMNLASSMGMKFLSKDDAGLPVISVYSERNNDIVQKMCDLFSKDIGGYDNSIAWARDIDMFKESRVLFEDSRFILLNNFRDMQDDFGILPHPKYDENQEEYYQRVSDVGTVVVLPKTNTHLNETSIVLEALAKESYYTLTPAFFDVALSVKYTRDDDSAEMLTLIRDSKMFNPIIESWGQSQFQKFTGSANNTFASDYAKAESKLIKEIEKMTEVFAD